MRKSLRSLALLACAVVLCGSFCLCTAAQGAAVDLTKAGSLTVRVQDGAGKPVPGGELRLYQVAKLTLPNGNMTYTLVNGFENIGVSLDPFLKDGSGAADLAKKLAARLPENVNGLTEIPDSAGTVRFEQLELGLYLVVQSKAADQYHALEPFLVTIPLREQENWVYAVDATPKTGTAATVPTTVTTVPSTATHPNGRLPQTGQLRWPIPVLAGGGITFLIVGWILSKREEKRNEASK